MQSQTTIFGTEETLHPTPPAPRAPTLSECTSLAYFIGQDYGFDEEEIQDLYMDLVYGRIAVFDKYMSDGPGFYGKVFVIVFGGGPEFHKVITEKVITEDRTGKMEDIGSEFTRLAVHRQENNDSWDPNESQIVHDPGCTGNPERCDCDRIDNLSCPACDTSYDHGSSVTYEFPDNRVEYTCGNCGMVQII